MLELPELNVDIDGVAADFRGMVAKIFNVPVAATYHKHYLDDIGITDEQMWAKIKAMGDEFWVNLEPLPWAFELFERCQSIGDTIFLSATSRDARSASGKVLWIQKHFGENFMHYLLGKRKEHCAKWNSVLIDDHDANIERFTERGGRGILFPQPWNSNHALANDTDRMPYVYSQLDKIARTHKLLGEVPKH